jgi:hypothetical protein
MLWLPVIYLPVALAADVSGNLDSGHLYADKRKRAGLPIKDGPCPDINAEVLVSRMYYTMRILLSPLM